MRKIIHRSGERGFVDHGWLKANHSFSFANYFDPEKMGFGVLRVLNDDLIFPDSGFGTHPHENMEITTIVLKGELTHEDSAGHKEVIRPGEVQVMSAGTGISHSEFNHSSTELMNLLQIWILPDNKGHEPRYDQKFFDLTERKNKFQVLISPDKNNESLWLNQNTYFSIIDLDKDKSVEYELNDKTNGVYFFLIEGKVNLAEETLSKRDAVGLWDFFNFNIEALEYSELLAIEVPMQ